MKNKTKFFIIFFLLFTSFYMFGDVLDWQGRELENDQNPKWYRKLKTGNEKYIRNQFEIENNEKIFFAICRDTYIEAARIKAKNDVFMQVTASHNLPIIKEINGLDFICEYWELLEENGEKFYEVCRVYCIDESLIQ